MGVVGPGRARNWAARLTASLIHVVVAPAPRPVVKVGAARAADHAGNTPARRADVRAAP